MKQIRIHRPSRRIVLITVAIIATLAALTVLSLRVLADRSADDFYRQTASYLKSVSGEVNDRQPGAPYKTVVEQLETSEKPQLASIPLGKELSREYADAESADTELAKLESVLITGMKSADKTADTMKKREVFMDDIQQFYADVNKPLTDKEALAIEKSLKKKVDAFNQSTEIADLEKFIDPKTVDIFAKLVGYFSQQTDAAISELEKKPTNLDRAVENVRNQQKAVRAFNTLELSIVMKRADKLTDTAKQFLDSGDAAKLDARLTPGYFPAAELIDGYSQKYLPR